MSSLIQEINHYPKESVYSQFFRICFLDDVFYEKDTLNKLGYKAKINTHTTSYIN